MIHPYIDCMLELRADGVKPDNITSVLAHVAEGTVHRLWEPLDTKQRVPNGYVAKFSSPYCMAVALLDGKVGFAQFDESRAHAPDLIAMAKKITYVVDPENPYPNRYTGKITVTLKDGTIIEKYRPNFRGGAHLPLSEEELTQKYRDNCAYGGWSEDRTRKVEDAVNTIAAGGAVDFSAARG
jgi:2-methylcitrate dehydratase PrpD